MAKMTINGLEVSVKGMGKITYISLTDIARARNPDAPADVIKNWMRTRFAIEFMGLWESLYNPNSKQVEIDRFETQSGSNAFTMSPQKWIETVNATGIISKGGINGGTYAHPDIAFEFASWISAEFKLYLILEFQRLKAAEHLELEWDTRRELSKINYRVQTDAIKESLVPTLTQRQICFVYANEADRLNVALFGQTAAEWRAKHPDKKGNMRDYATVHQLLVIANMESYNAAMIKDGVSSEERIRKLNEMAKHQLPILTRSVGPFLSGGNLKDDKED